MDSENLKNNGYPSHDLEKTAESFVLKNSLNEAIEIYLKIVKEQPNNPKYYFRIGEIYLLAKQNTKGFYCLKKAGDIFFQNGIYKNALDTYQKIVRGVPDNLEVLEKMAFCSVEVSDLIEARKIYQELADRTEKIGDKKKHYFYNYQLFKLTPSNTFLLKKVIEQLKSVNENEKIIDVYLLAGKNSVNDGNLEEALEYYNEGLVIDSQNYPLLNAVTDILIHQKKYSRAVITLKSLIPAMPKDINLYRKIILISIDGNLSEDIKSTAEQLFKVDPSQINFIMEVLNRLIQHNKIDVALKLIDIVLAVSSTIQVKLKIILHLEEIVKKDSRNLQALLKLEDIYSEPLQKDDLLRVKGLQLEYYTTTQDYTKAMECIEKLESFDPENEEIKAKKTEVKRFYDEMMRVLYGKVEADGKETSDEVELTNELSDEDDISDVDISMVDIDFLLKYGQNKKAINVIEKMLLSMPDDIILREKLKNLYVKEGHKKKAAQECLALAQFYQNKGISDKALKFSREAQKINPDLTSTVTKSETEKEEEGDKSILNGNLSEISLLDRKSVV